VVVKDLITRSYGLLVHSYQLNTRETLAALSMIKLGIDLGWVLGLTDQEVNAIFVQVQRAHLLYLLEQPISIEDPQAIQRQRAAFVHKRLKDVQLKETLL
jgi:protein arginine kinase